MLQPNLRSPYPTVNFTFVLKIDKTPHPTCPPDVGGVGGGHTLPPGKTFCRKPYLTVLDKSAYRP
ncbi:hypothetical protein [Microcystis aeruginosa]|uniref:hypothetical protein n=1 Tax=Microcystis aeruginosa TaxID=1126 RepID=UPI000776A1F3|nr:hypothetical protein [Microcystis aeruginosa]KXS91074.1 hypothetical protein OA58_12280 [Microcystis aeruginosa NIES-88]